MEKISSNKGAGTARVDQETISGWSLSKLEKLRQSIRNDTYKPQPVKRVEIPRKNSQEPRPLGLPTVKDRIIQEVFRKQLEAYYEPLFSEWSYGFRPGKKLS